MKSLSKPEPDPVVTSESGDCPVWELVIQDMKQRDEFGRRKYGVPLRTFDGRDSLVDLYQELLDAVVYVRKLIEERKVGDG